ncbi:Zn-dependent hydrolase [Siminovitchia acidinfaciens]|uniref:Zn-dependent hydrolase n=1 Tax=Siminovitchia acidinfaciens TaxID=2321395 RepID=A0A429XUQ6_9BACI|nr:M20 family metallo-hydrolase [Siminovitchia acidinfaciens]RST71881.1 Zn-dependent hydrolase [Siminovitchia acidinfaciens]
MTLKINETRFLTYMEKSSSIGATENNGLNRLTLTEEDKEMRDTFIQLLKEANLEVRVDDFGNIYGRREGKIKDAPVIAFGSHLDTQPCGGRFDGILGVLAGLEVMQTLNDHGIETDYPLELINFTNEEGARFNPPLLGAGGVTGIFTKDFIYGVKDSENITFEEALTAIGYKGLETNRLQDVKSYVELHIEQGPILDNENIDIGVVQGIQGLTRVNVRVEGITNHAGGARMEERKDALLAAAYMIIAANKITKEIEGLRVTVGKIDNFPNVINVIPGSVEFVIDVRHDRDEMRDKSVELIKDQMHQLAREHNVQCEVTRGWEYDMVPFDKNVIQKIGDSAKSLNYSTMGVYSGPGHDAKYMSTYAPTAMIFVKSVNGVSHNENELTENEDLIKGANVLLNTVLQLAKE